MCATLVDFARFIVRASATVDECSHVPSIVKLGSELCLLPAVYEGLQP